MNTVLKNTTVLAEGPAVKVTSAKLCFFHEKNRLPNRGYSILPVQSTHETGCTLANSASLLTYCAACEARDICSNKIHTHTHTKKRTTIYIKEQLYHAFKSAKLFHENNLRDS